MHGCVLLRREESMPFVRMLTNIKKQACKYVKKTAVIKAGKHTARKVKIKSHEYLYLINQERKQTNCKHSFVRESKDTIKQIARMEESKRNQSK